MKKYDSFLVPSSFLEKIHPEDRPTGSAGWTSSEAQARGAVRAEIPEQRDFAKWLDYKEILWIRPRPDKKSTVRRGAADFSIYHASKTLFLEFKALGCKQSADQIAFEKQVIRAGHTYKVVYSATEAIVLSRDFFGV